MIRSEFTGMLPGAIEKYEELLAIPEVAALDPVVVKGYDASAGKNSFFYWGAACRISCSDMAQLKNITSLGLGGTLPAPVAKSLGIVWLSDDGDMAYTGGLSIDDFKTFRVNGNLELMPE